LISEPRILKQISGKPGSDQTTIYISGQVSVFDLLFCLPGNSAFTGAGIIPKKPEMGSQDFDFI
jgi:hypothetical protein